jgi:error-prone DNA polymerase
MRRSMQRMKDLEGRLRSGMTRNGISPEAQDNIVQGISSFAMYGFPESHAASFALIAYASAYLKVHYLAAFTCGLLNNQPMGFYSPAVLIKDAQRHGLRVRPIDIQKSEWLCTLEPYAEKLDPLKGTGFSPYISDFDSDGALAPEGLSSSSTKLALRIGLNYVKGLRQSSAEAIIAARRITDPSNTVGAPSFPRSVRKGWETAAPHTATINERPFSTVEDLAARVPDLNRKELVALASVGALNSLGQVEHRRDALWQVEQAGRPVGPLLRGIDDILPASKPLKKMTTDERLTADYSGTGLTAGPHPMSYHRDRLRREGYLSAQELAQCATNRQVRVAGCVISRQRPGTAKGFVFLSLEDETGIANIILTPDIFEQNRLVVTRSRYLNIQGKLQNQDGVIHVKGEHIEPMTSISQGAQARSWH